jgi:8-oxo-dGTP diphosphatase
MVERKEKNSYEYEGVIFLVYKDGKFLIEERTRNDSAHFGYFTIPAGTMEQNELPEDALLRELSEEQGIRATETTLIDSFESMTFGGKHYLMHAYLITKYEGELENKEQEKCKLHWVTPKEADNLLCIASSRLILFKSLAIINKEEHSKD